MDGFDCQLLDRLPLAQSVLLILGHCWNDAFLNDLFEQHRGRCYTEKIEFPALVGIVRDALILHGGSANKALDRALTQGRLQAAVSAVYQKLGRTPLSVSEGFLRGCTERMQSLLPAYGADLPPCLAGLQAMAFDGKTIKHVARRLKLLRGIRGKMLGGKLLVALDISSGLVLAMNPEADAFRNDAALVDGLLEQLPRGQQPRVFIADRQFCDLRLMALIPASGDHFIIRHNRTAGFFPDRSHSTLEGKDAHGRRWTDQIGFLGAPDNRKRRRVRFITLYRPGEENVTIITDLMDQRAFPAEQLLEAYLRRWGIEQVFQKVTEVFSLKRLIGTTPKATIFQASFCFVLYNAIQLVKGHVACGAERPVEQVSTKKLFDDVKDEMISWATVTRSSAAAIALGPIPKPQQLRKRLASLLKGVWTNWWIKAPTRPPAKRETKPTYAKSGRASVYRILQESKPRKRHQKSIK